MFSHHLIYVTIYTTREYIVFLEVCGSAKTMGWWDRLTTDEFQYSLKFQMLTDVSVMHLLDLPEVTNKILSSTRSSWWRAPWKTVNWTGVLKFYLAASEDFACSNFYLEILSVTSTQCILLANTNFNSLLNAMFTNIAVTCENMTFLLPWQIAK